MMSRSSADVAGALAETAQHLAAHRYAEARRLCEALAAAHPDDPEVLHVAGLVRFRQGEADAAIDLLSRSLELRPDSADVLTNLGAMQEELGNHEAAFGCFAAAHDLAPQDLGVLQRLGRSLGRLENYAGAEAAWRELIALTPQSALAYCELGYALRGQGRLGDALEAFRRASELDPHNPGAWHELGEIYSTAGLADSAVAACARAVALTGDPTLHRTFICTQPLAPSVTPEEMVAARRQWAARFADPLTFAASAPGNEPAPERVLRIGYVLADTCRYHTHAMVLLPLVEAHDRSAVEVHCFSDTPAARADEITGRFRVAATVHETHRLDDEALAWRLREQKIDIAVDVMGHPAGSRLLALARRPAPIQLCFAYQGSTGMTAIDHVIGDAHLVPPAARSEFSEAVLDVSLGHVYQPLCAVPELARQSPFERRGDVTFGSFGRLSRINDTVLAAWSRILAAVPRSRLALKLGAEQPMYIAWFKDRLRSAGVPAERVEFAPWSRSAAEHLATHNEVDMVLDTFPYGGVTTSCEALTMGVPIVTLESDRIFGRYAAAFLRMLCLPELAATSADDYVAAAVALAQDHDRRAAIRRDLAARFRASPICDGHRLARDLETAYRDAWRRWCAGRTADVR